MAFQGVQGRLLDAVEERGVPQLFVDLLEKDLVAHVVGVLEVSPVTALSLFAGSVALVNRGGVFSGMLMVRRPLLGLLLLGFLRDDGRNLSFNFRQY